MNLQESDKKNIWHPFTQEALAKENIHIVKAKGSILFDANGKEYIDAVSSWWVNIHGHSHPYIAGKISEQAKELEHVIFAGFTHTPAITLSENLLKLLPDHFEKIFFSDNGSTAVEVAIKMALQYYYNQGERSKNIIIAFENAYHGDTFGAMSVGGKSTFNAPFQELLFEVKYIPTPHAENREAVLALFNQYIAEGNVAAFLFEPLVQGSAGMLMHDAIYLDELIAAANNQNIVCIADEVMTGFGRTGKIFASEYLKNRADIICLSKGITGGFMPLGVTACTNKIYQAFYSNDRAKTFFHGHSYTGNPLACAAANASMDLLNENSCRQRIAYISAQHAIFAASLKNETYIKNVRQTGTILALDLNTPENSSYFHSMRDELYNFFIDKGVLLRPLGNTIYMMPPYCITETELKKIYTTIEEAIAYFKNK